MNNKLKIHLLVNEIAGNGNAKKIAFQTQQLLNSKNIVFDIQKSTYAGEAIYLAEEYGNENHEENEVLVVIGGDGSLNEVLNGIKRSKNPMTPFMYLPAGTGNDFGRAAHLTFNPEEMLDHLENNLKPDTIDCGAFKVPNLDSNNYYFANSFGIGFDAFVNHLSNISKLKNLLNKLNKGNLIYGLNILSALYKQDTFGVDIVSDGQVQHYDNAFLVTTTNHPYLGGGISLLPCASIQSHKIDTVVVEKYSINKLLKLLISLLKDGSHVEDPQFHYVEAEEIFIRTNKKEFIQVDGEEIKQDLFKFEFTVDQFNLFR